MARRLNVILTHLHKKPLTTNNCSIPTTGDREFRYTLNGNCLTNEQRQLYEDNGYLVIKKLISDDLIDLCSDHFSAICNGAQTTSRMFLMKEPSLLKAGAKGENLYYKVQDLLYDEVFSQYTACPLLLDYVECFTGPNVTAIHSMLINKPPNAQETTVHPLHQDLLYFPFRPADLIVGTWTAMEKIDTENGCLIVVPGSHKLGQLYTHSTKSKAGSYKTFYGINNEIDVEPIPLLMDKGDTVFLHPLVVHGSGPNHSKRFRKAISCHYAASECHAINIEGTEHSELADDIKSTALKNFGVSYSFVEIMKIRSLVVRGSEGFTRL